MFLIGFSLMNVIICIDVDQSALFINLLFIEPNLYVGLFLTISAFLACIFVIFYIM